VAAAGLDVFVGAADFAGEAELFLDAEALAVVAAAGLDVFVGAADFAGEAELFLAAEALAVPVV
jgi:hypothetical protein